MISVIMGVYNPRNKDIFNLSLQSILNQTYSNFEFIICDDGSNEATREMLDEAAALDERVKVIHNNGNQGLAFSLNHCLEIAQGDYIARMDDDDISSPSRFEIERKFLDEHPDIAWVGCNADLIDAEGVVWGNRKLEEYPTTNSLLFNSPFIHPTVMIRREVIKKADGYSVAKQTRRAEDYDLWLRLYAMGYRGANIQETLFQYREDAFAYTKRKYRYRIDEAIVRYQGFSRLKLFPVAWIYVLKPLVVGLIPGWLLRKMRARY